MILIRVYVWYVDLFHDNWILIYFLIEVILLIFLWVWLCCLRRGFWMLSKAWRKLIRLIDVHVSSNINLVLCKCNWIWHLIFNMMSILCYWSMHLKFDHHVIIIGLIMRDHVRLLYESLTCAFNSFMAWNYLLRGDDFRSFGKLNNVVCFWDYAFRVVVSWFLNDLNLLLF